MGSFLGDRGLDIMHIHLHVFCRSQAGALEVVARNLASVKLHGSTSHLSQTQPKDASHCESGGSGSSSDGGRDSEGLLKVHTWFLCSLTASHLSAATRSAIAEFPEVLHNLLRMLDCPMAPKCGM